MKEKQGNKPNSYGKLMKRMLIYLGIGGVCGFFVGIFMTFGVKNGMSDLSDLVRPLALPIIAVIFVVSIVLMEFYSRKLKDTMKHLEEAEDEQYEVLSYEEEKYGAMLMNCNVISQVCDIIVLSFTFSPYFLAEAHGNTKVTDVKTLFHQHIYISVNHSQFLFCFYVLTDALCETFNTKTALKLDGLVLPRPI